METLFRIAEASANGILYLMVLMSVISVAIMIERYFALKKVSSKSSGVAQGFKTLIHSEDLNQIEKLSEESESLEGRALGYGMNFVKKHGAEGLDDLFNSYKTVERPGLEKNLNILGTIASNAPYVGLLGTVMGIMKAFNDLANAPGQGNEVVMAGIAHALVSTAVGLAVAIPAVAAFNYFQKKVGLVLANIDAARDLCLAYTKSRRA
ncbi:MAG TPA: MotA/TolQ/ExbB proton channel family protein [Bdellovibrionales bacterium]|nr:MotA/TolQ/ExbB proton channel family protein [Bdellovibrionales bacterium]